MATARIDGIDSDAWIEVKRSFAEALEHPHRSAFLVRLPEDIRAEVVSLLAAYDEAHEFLEVSPLLPATIGSYRVLRELGRGGMGSVYLARRDDEEYRKLVAVKVLRAGFPRSFQDRFRRERQILASLDHPNISTLFDAGSLPDGRPYCVMEYVEGLPIHEYCRLHRISSREIMALLLPICSAVQYAHQHLVIHRDLKPANILIRPDGVPKLLDFGIAHLAEEGEAEALTRTGQALFTPEYASPEQLKGVRVTTASDVYSLGVLLHRLLTGNLPYPAQGVNAIEAARLVLDSDPARAGIDADLDSILLKALRKEPHLRYATVAAMAADIENYLAGRAVGARRSTFGYVAGKFMRRNCNRLLLTAAALLLAVSLGVVTRQGSLVQARREQVRVLARSLVLVASPAPRTIAERTQLVQLASTHLDQLLVEAPRDSGFLLEVAEAYLSVAAMSENLKNYSSMRTAAARARQILESLPTRTAEHRRALTGAYRTSLAAHQWTGDLPAAIEYGRKAIALLSAQNASTPISPSQAAERLSATQDLAECLSKAGRSEEAVAAIRAIQPILDEVDFASFSAHDAFGVAKAEGSLADVLARGGDTESALRLWRRAAARLQKITESAPHWVNGNDPGEIHGELARIHLALDKKPAAANALLAAIRVRRARLESDPAYAHLRYQHGVASFQYGKVLQESGRPMDALPYFEEALAAFERVARENQDVYALELAARALTNAGKVRLPSQPGQALQDFRKALHWREEVVMRDRSNLYHERSVSFSHLEIGDALLALSRPEEAAASYRRAIAIRAQLLQRDPHSKELQADLAKANARLVLLEQR